MKQLKHVSAVVGVAVLVLGAQAGVDAQTAPQDVVVHVTDLPANALSEFEFWKDPASPGGRLVGYPNRGDELDPPPEDDPHVIFPVQGVRQGVPYRCWIHMKVGAPLGRSQANMVYVQFSDAVDAAGKEVLRPYTESYLTARGPTQEGWSWVPCDASAGGRADIRFATGGKITVRIQAGMEGVGFDQVVLSPSRFLDKPPSQAVVAK
jgi:hypothetical protein